MKLPPEIKQKAMDVLNFLLKKRDRHPKVTSKPIEKHIETTNRFEHRRKSKFSEKAQRIAMARADVVRVYRQEVRKAPQGRKVAAQIAFVNAFNKGTYAKLYADLGKPVSRATIARWAAVMKESADPWDLKPKWGRHRRGRTKLTVEQKHCLQYAAIHQQCLAEAVRHARKLMREQGVPDTLSEATYLRFLKRWREQHSAPGSNKIN